MSVGTDKSVVRAVGDYAHYLTYYTGSGKFTSGSFVPRGDLFNLSIGATSGRQDVRLLFI